VKPKKANVFQANTAPRPTEGEQSVGGALRRLRKESRVSVRMLASKCGFSPSFISQVELGQASPSIASLDRIALALGGRWANSF
jgi:transcriptional regulator with XRE-family HTH domain